MTDDDKPPAHWPPGVEYLANRDMAELGIERRTGRLYWRGKPVEVERPLTLGKVERAAVVAAALATVGTFVVELANALHWFPPAPPMP